MNLKERRKQAILGRALTMTQLTCKVERAVIGLDSSSGKIIRLDGYTESHHEYGMEEYDNGPLSGIKFTCRVVDEVPKETFDDEQEKIVAQFQYSPRFEDYEASVELWIGAGEDGYREILDMSKCFLTSTGLEIIINLKTNASICEKVESGKIEEGYIPINEWSFNIVKRENA